MLSSRSAGALACMGLVVSTFSAGSCGTRGDSVATSGADASPDRRLCTWPSTDGGLPTAGNGPGVPALGRDCAPREISTLQLGIADGGVLAAGACMLYGSAPDGQPGGVVDAPPVLIFSQPVTGAPPTALVRTRGRVSRMSFFNGRLHWYRASGLDDAHRYFEWRSLTDDSFGSVEVTERTWSFDEMTSGPEGIYVAVRIYGDASGGGIFVFTRDGQRRRIVALNAPGPMAADADALYYLTMQAQGALVRRSFADGRETTLGTGMSYSVALDRDNVYTQGPNDRIVGFEKTTGKQVVDLASTVSYGGSIAAIRGDVAWANQDGTLVRQRIDGACRQEVLNDGFVFVTDGEALYLKTRTPGEVVLYR